MKRPTLSKARVPMGLALSVIAFFLPVVFAGRAFFLKDAQLVVYPMRLALRQRLLDLDLPHWMPHLDLGLPFMANPANGVLYPLNLILLLPAPFCVGVFIVAHSVLAVVGSWLLLRALKASPFASAAGALCFALGGYMVSLTWIANYMMSLAWVPMVAWAWLGALRYGRMKHAAITGLFWGLQILSGEPQGAIFTAWCLFALTVAYPHRRGSQKRTRYVMLAASLAIALVLAMPQVLTAVELLPRSRRAQGIDLTQAMHWSLHPLRLLELVVPWLYGNPVHFDEFLGFFMNDEASGVHRDPWIATPYFGSIALVFATLGVIFPRRRHRWWVVATAILTVLALLLALGRYTPVFQVYFESVPGAALFRYPAKFFGLAALSSSLLVAAGVDAWLSDARARRAFVYGAIAIGACAALGALTAPHVAAALHDLRPEVPETQALQTVRWAALSELGVVTVAAVTLIWMRRQYGRQAALAAALVISAQLLVRNVAAYQTVPGSVYVEASPLARALLALRKGYEPQRIFHEATHLEIAGIDSVPSALRARAIAAGLMKNTGIVFGIGYARAYLSSGEGAKHALWEEAVGWRRQLLDLYGIRYLVLPASVDLQGVPGLRQMPEGVGTGTSVYENLSALPFAYAVKETLLASDQRAAIALARDPTVSQGWTAVVEEGPPSKRVRKLDGRRAGRCQLTKPLADSIELECFMDEAGWVVVNASHHPNWLATVDDQAQSILRANAFVMALRVPAGKHALRLEYAEPALPFGLFVSLAGCLLVGLLVYRDRQRRWASSRRPARN